MFFRRCLYLVMIIILFSCLNKKESIEKNIPSLKDVFKNDFLIGAAIENSQLDSEVHKQLFLKHFNSVTAENCMKMERLYPMGNKLDFTEADELVKFATDNNINIRFHTLIWHEQCPGWFFLENRETVSKEKLKERMKNHIMQVVGRYKGKIYAYDVVNEPIDGDQPDGLKRNPYYNILGEEYIDLAFRWAREADPNAKLYINEIFSYQPHKRRALVNLVKRLKERGVPIDGIGMQMHCTITDPTIGAFEAAIKAYSELGVEIQITELDMTVYDGYQKGSYRYIHPRLLNEQAHRIKDIFSIINKYKDSVKSVTFWGMADDHTWLNYHFVERNDWPLPFDVNLKAKPFYWAMVDPGRLDPRINNVEVIGGTINIDGVKDDLWQFANSFPRILKNNKFKADIKAVWDSKYLYVLVDAKGIDKSKNNDITFFIDEKNNKKSKMGKKDYIIKYKLDKKWKNTEDSAYIKTGKSYIFETRIPFKYIDTDIAESIGFDILVKNGKNFIKWNDLKDINGKKPKFWGVLDLVKGSKRHQINYGQAVIDAEKDSIYDSAEPIIVDKFIQGIEDEKNVFKGATAKVYGVWDENALYIYTEVADPFLSSKSATAYLQDSIEIFIDENNKKTSFYEKDDAQYRISYKNRQSFGATGSTDGFKSAAKIIPGGYAVEALVPFRTLKGSDGLIIGFDFQVNDDQGSGVRDSISKWNDPTNDSWQSTSGYGVLILKK